MPDDATLDWFDLARTLHRPRVRAKTGRFLVEGWRFLVRAFEAAMPIDAVLLAARGIAEHETELFDGLRERDVPIVPLSWGDFHRITTRRRPSGVAAVVRQRWTPLADARPRPEPWVGVERVRSPGNLGSLLRTMDAVGSPGLVMLGRVDPHEPATVRATMGSHFAATMVRTNLGALRRWCDDRDAFLVGACGGGTCEYDEVRYPPGTVLLLGDERKGLSHEARTACDLLVRIPMLGQLDSLNLAVAGSVVLYEAFRQRRRSPG